MTDSPALPATHRVVQLAAYTGSDTLTVVEKPLPKPTGGQVLIKVSCAPINPSDVMFTRGLYGLKKALPTVPGFEGSGVVVDAGNVVGKALMGRRVAFVAKDDADGTWAEYCLADITACFPLLAGVSDEQGAMLIVNPLTAWGMCHLAEKGDHKAIVHTAAASALGRFLCVYANKRGVPVIHVVRREEQRKSLEQLGALHVLNQSDADFDQQLRTRAKDLGATLAFDAVAGPMTGRLLEALPKKSEIRVYGALSDEPLRLNPGSLIFGRKKVEGYYLTDLFSPTTFPALLKGMLDIQSMVEGGYQTSVAQRRPLAEAKEAISDYWANMSAGKTLFVP
jgi:NADPH2:quinone reductase